MGEDATEREVDGEPVDDGLQVPVEDALLEAVAVAHGDPVPVSVGMDGFADAETVALPVAVTEFELGVEGELDEPGLADREPEEHSVGDGLGEREELTDPVVEEQPDRDGLRDDEIVALGDCEALVQRDGDGDTLGEGEATRETVTHAVEVTHEVDEALDVTQLLNVKEPPDEGVGMTEVDTDGHVLLEGVADCEREMDDDPDGERVAAAVREADGDAAALREALGQREFEGETEGLREALEQREPRALTDGVGEEDGDPDAVRAAENVMVRSSDGEPDVLADEEPVLVISVAVMTAE